MPSTLCAGSINLCYASDAAISIGNTRSPLHPVTLCSRAITSAAGRPLPDDKCSAVNARNVKTINAAAACLGVVVGAL